MQFQTEVEQLLHLVTHALYSNKEIFLRELISNSSDAADKLRFTAINNDGLYEGDSELKIWVTYDKKAKTITIRDNGIGMSREDVISNLGTIAKSGTREFLKNLSSDQAKDTTMIGQFGVGFYSAYVVADHVVVNTRRAGLKSEEGVRWESDGKSAFNIENITLPERGTEVILHLKKDEEDFLDEWRLRGIITKYSDHIQLPILMEKQAMPDEEIKEGENKETEQKEKAPEFEPVNQAKAMWRRPKSQIKDDEYKAFYKHVAHAFDEPLAWTHNKVEGKFEYTTLLYIPTQPPFDLFNTESKHGLKLYIQRVFIMDDAEKLLPNYLRFVRGIVDSNDLPLNISRELLQSNKVIESIKSSCIKRILSLLENMADKDPAKYQTFWKAFGPVLKEGPAEDFSNKERIANLFRFASTESGEDQSVSLKEYVGRMKEGQDKIYYITAENYLSAKNSPHLEIFRKKGTEVLLLTDRVDEWLVAHLTEFDGKQFQSVAKGDIDLGDDEDKPSEEEQKKTEASFESVIKQMKEALGDTVKEVRLTNRLTDSPACLVSEEAGMSLHLQRIMEQAGQDMPAMKPILEINPEHLILKRMQAETDDARFADWTHLLFDQALLTEGGRLEDPAAFAKRLNQLMVELAV